MGGLDDDSHEFRVLRLLSFHVKERLHLWLQGSGVPNRNLEWAAVEKGSVGHHLRWIV